MNEQAHAILNRYLSKELGRTFHLPDITELSRQRAAFLARFGPEQLAEMSGAELLRQIPNNVSNDQPMDYWLEFKNDEEFTQRLFGGIGGGSAAKYGLWQEKKTGSWRAKLPDSPSIQYITEDDALGEVEVRRTEMLAAVAAVRTFDGKTAEAIDPEAFQQAIESAAPRWSSSGWFRKYLHLNAPDLIQWSSASTYIEAALYRVGLVPSDRGNYVNDLGIIRFWNSLPALSDLPVQIRYRADVGLRPRRHWCHVINSDTLVREMLAHEHLALGPAQVGNLAEAIALGKKRDIQVAIGTAFQDAGLSARSIEVRDLTELVRLKEGSVIALFSDTSTVVAVGEVTGGYRFAPGTQRPHQVPVRWHHNHSFKTSVPVDVGASLTRLPRLHPAVATIEASLLVHGIGPWPGFRKFADATSYDRSNDHVARFLDRLSDLSSIAEEDPFKARAYTRAAETVRASEEEVRALADAGRLRELPTIGEVIAQDVEQLLQTGTSDTWEDLTRTYPATLLDLLKIPNLGPARVRRIFRELGVKNLTELRKATDDGRLAALAGFGPNVVGTVLDFLHRPPRPASDAPPPLEGLARQVAEMLDRKRQVILYGPPGTGKTYHAERIALEVVARHNFNCVPSQLSERQRDTVYGRRGADPFIATCTFHPMYAYEDFIEGYRPDHDGFKLEPGIFKRLAAAAQAQPSKRFVLIVDEINRGNIPKIFGELITLIEASKRGTTSAYLPLSKEPFTVPDNLLLIGTMNTADRSILLLDTALRRRFAFKELLPEPQLLRSSAIGDVALSTWLRALNRRIVEQLGRDGRNLQVGHAYLMPGGKPAPTLSRIGEVVRDELWPLLQEYCYEDQNKLASILAADNGGLFDREASNLRFDLFEPGREEELIQALIAIVTPEDKKHDAMLGPDVDDDEADDDDEEVGDEDGG